jgi:hypothetical protein
MVSIFVTCCWLVCIGSTSVCVLVLAYAKSNSPQQARQVKKKPPQIDLAKYSKPEAKLIRMLYGDQGAAARLINAVQSSHPNKNPVWCLEKVIYDLKRDRRV